MYKQVIVIRGDLKMSKGKIAVQACHASVSALDVADKKLVKEWKKAGQKKVVVTSKNIQELFELKSRADKLKIANSLVIDAGLTELEPGTATALGIGPEKGVLIDKVTGSLPLLD